jgi:hypothetical protein
MGLSEGSSMLFLPQTVRFQKRKTMGLYLLDSGGFEVRAPRGTPQRVIERFVGEHQSWLCERLQGQKRDLESRSRRWLSGAHHYFKGDVIQLRISHGYRPSVELVESGLQLIHSQPDNPEFNEAYVTEWLRHQAKQHFQQRVDHFFNHSQFSGLAAPKVKVRKMKSRWGSCSSKGNVNFNLWLINYPAQYIDYVVVHELCHMLEFSHSERFYRLVSNILPDWRALELGLERHPAEPGDVAE